MNNIIDEKLQELSNAAFIAGAESFKRNTIMLISTIVNSDDFINKSTAEVLQTLIDALASIDLTLDDIKEV